MAGKAVFEVEYSYQYEGDDDLDITNPAYACRTVAASDAMIAAKRVVDFEMAQTSPEVDEDGNEVEGGKARKCIRVLVYSVTLKSTIDDIGS